MKLTVKLNSHGTDDGCRVDDRGVAQIRDEPVACGSVKPDGGRRRKKAEETAEPIATE